MANWRSLSLRGARSANPCSLRWRVVVRVAARRRLPFASRGSISVRLVSGLGGRVEAFLMCIDMGFSSYCEAYNFSHEIWGSSYRL